MPNLLSYPPDICHWIAASLVAEAHGNLLDKDWNFVGCRLVDDAYTLLQVDLVGVYDEARVIPVQISAVDVPSVDPVGAGRGVEDLVLELISTFSHQVAPDQIIITPVRLPLARRGTRQQHFL